MENFDEAVLAAARRSANTASIHVRVELFAAEFNTVRRVSKYGATRGLPRTLLSPR